MTAATEPRLSHEEVVQRVRDELLEQDSCGHCEQPLSNESRLVACVASDGQCYASLLCSSCGESLQQGPEAFGSRYMERLERKLATGTIGRCSPSLFDVHKH
jgi:hypothetical protein